MIPGYVRPDGRTTIRPTTWPAALEAAAWALLLAVPFFVIEAMTHRYPDWSVHAAEAGAFTALAAAMAVRYRWHSLTGRARERLETLGRCTPDLLFETDDHGTVTFTNDRSWHVLQRRPDEVLGRSIRDLAEGPVPILDAPLGEGEAMTTWNTRWRHGSGKQIALTAVLTPLGRSGAPGGVRGVLRDQQDRLETERALRESEERFRAALNTARNGIMLVGNDGHLLLSNDALRRLLGRTEEQMADLTVADVVPGTHVDQFVALMASRMWSDAVPSQYELQLKDAEGRPLDVEITLSPVREAGRNTGTLIEVHDLTEARRTSETIRRMADYDRLTGLPNRELFDRHVQRALIDARYQGRSVAVLMLDLDRFKLINDTLGHTSGDRLLRAVAERLAAHIPPQHILARFGGDEFLLLAPDLGGRAAAEGIARRVQAAFRQPFDHDGHHLKVSVSIGVAVAAGEGADADLLIRIADAAMHQAKDQGRDGYVVGSESAGDPARLRLELEGDLRGAVERHELDVYFQPQLDPDTGAVVSVEALLRWQHPQRGFVSPSEFVPLLEETGLIVEVGESVLRMACAEVQRWYTAGGRRVRVAVNVSPLQLLDPNFGDMVRSALADTGLPAEALELELTETAAVLDLESVLGVLGELQALGITTAIDDFGVGESWLARLSDYPIRTLKVDRYFVAGIAEPGNALAIVKAVIALGHALGLVVIAEGVETEAQLDALRAADCDLVQGFYYAPALTSDECARFVERTAA
ncbi:MAG: putative bifunctional diguanylate cyclase/phosphodiesterase [Dehalococcoidia bacterium]